MFPEMRQKEGEANINRIAAICFWYISIYSVSENISTLITELLVDLGLLSRDQIDSMAINGIIILCTIVAQAVSAPSGCIESCTSYHRFYQTQSSGGSQDHAGLTQAIANLENLQSSRPGNWTEHNQYRTDGGNGKVFEERGQYVQGPKRVSYYKKNYTSSYSTGNINGADLLGIGKENIHDSQHLSDIQRIANQIGSVDSVAQQHEYSAHRQHHLQSTKSVSERLEDLSEHNGNIQIAQGASHLNAQNTQGQHYGTSTEPGNWRRVNSYKTNGGHGQVFEEEGQYVDGPKKVRYFKKNYTSGYRVSGIPVPDITRIGVHDIQREIEKLHHESVSNVQSIPTTGNTAMSQIAQSNINREDIQIAGTYNHGTQQHSGISTNTAHHYAGHLDTSRGTNEYLPYRSTPQNSYGAENFNAYERHEGYTRNVQHTAQHPTAAYTQVHTDNNSAYTGNAANQRTMGRITDELQQTEHSNVHHSGITEHQISSDDTRQNVYNQHIGSHTNVPGQATHYKEHWSTSSHTREASGPYASNVMYTNDANAQSRNRYANQHSEYHAGEVQNGYTSQSRENNFNSAHRVSSGKLLTGTIDLGLGGISHSADCDQDTLQQTQYRSQYHRKYKRSAKHDELRDMQQHRAGGLSQQTQGLYNQHTDELDDLQQHTGNLEFGQQTQKPHKPQRLTFGRDDTQQTEDLTQWQGRFDDLTQQTHGKLEFGQQAQHPSYDARWRMQGTTGKLEFGQQSRNPWRHTSNNEDLTQQTSGKLEFGQQSQQQQRPRKPISGNQHLEDLSQQNEDFTQQTGDFDDFTQQTSGKLEFGQQSQQQQKPRRQTNDNQYFEDLTQQNEDLTQHTGDFDDFTQQISGKLEFGQHSQEQEKPWKPTSGNQHFEDLTQQTGGFDDFTQQTSGKLEFGQQSQQQQKPWKPSGNQHFEDVTQQNEDLTQQTSGKLEFGQQSQQQQKPWKPTSGNQHFEDVTQQNEDLTQQTSGKLEFGQQSQQQQKPWKPTSGNQHFEDLSQQNEDLTQHTGEFDDITQQTSGKLEFGQQSQQQQKPWKPTSGNQHFEDLTQQNEDLTQQTGGFDDFTQQTSGKLEFGQQSQQQQKPWKPTSGNQHFEDLTQQNEDLTQQTSGKLEFGQQSQQQQKPWKPTSGNQHSEDLTQQNEDLTQHTGKFDDITQQTSGKLEFGQQSQQQQKPWKPTSGNQHSEDLTQQNEDLTQQTDGFDDFTQQSDENRWNQASRMPNGWYKEDLGQQSVQSPSDFPPPLSQLNHVQDHKQEPEASGMDTQSHEQPSGVIPIEQTESDKHGSLEIAPKPMPKPSPRPRYQRTGLVNTLRVPGITQPYFSPNLDLQNQHNAPKLNDFDKQKSGDSDSDKVPVTNIHRESSQITSEPETEDLKKEDLRGDQAVGSSTDRTIPKDSNQQNKVNGFNVERENVDHVNWLHKSNDATVGLQWHYTYHPSDLTNSEPVHSNSYLGLNYNSPTQHTPIPGQFSWQSRQDGREQGSFQQQTRPFDFGQQQTQNEDKHGNIHQQTTNTDSFDSQYNNNNQQNSENKYTLGNTYQQSANTEQSTSRYDNFYRRYTLSQQFQSDKNREESELGQQGDNTQRQQGHLEFASRPNIGVKGRIRNRQREQPEGNRPVIDTRILEVYGGDRDSTNDDEDYRRVTINPSAILPPINHEDAWFIREKPKEETTTPNIPTTEETTMIVPIEPTETTTENLSFWDKFRRRVTNSYEKTRDKIKDIFT